ncbi:MAG: adenosine-deaminase [uncultured bacterium]|nr:MAG: adenosine-deaminase [uncultured bacterium]
MKHQKNISETAYLTATCRSKKTAISRDVYARFFIDKEAEVLRKKYLKKVSPKEDLLQALRNNFFLKKLKLFFKGHPEGIFVNIGAGFSTYPFLLSDKFKYIEVDTPGLIDEKKKKTKELTDNNLLPARNIKFYSADLNVDNDLNELKKYLSKELKNKKSFILIEGLIYYLREDKAIRLLEIVKQIQSKNSVLGILALSEKFIKNPIYKRFKNFVEKNTDDNRFEFTFFKPKVFELLRGYACLIKTDYSKLSNINDINKIKSDEDIFWEDFYILKKK